MNGRKREEQFLRNSVFLTGFLGGLSLTPGNILYKVLESILDLVSKENNIFLLNPTFLRYFVRGLILLGTAISILKTYQKGVILGLVAVFLAYIGGLLVQSLTELGAFLLIFGVIIGIIGIRWRRITFTQLIQS